MKVWQAGSYLLEERGAKVFRLHTGHRSEGNLRLYRRVGYQAVGTSQGNASILAMPVPEPSTVGAFLVATCAMLLRRPRRA